MKIFTIPTKPEEVIKMCPFCQKAELHPQLKGRIFTDESLPKALAIYLCGTYIWDNGEFDLGSACIGMLNK